MSMTSGIHSKWIEDLKKNFYKKVALVDLSLNCWTDDDFIHLLKQGLDLIEFSVVFLPLNECQTTE